MIIYKAMNNITGEIYIGQTKKALCDKKRDHVYEAFKRKATNKFHSALREFGMRAFDWAIVAECKSYKALSALEARLIKKYRSIELGYNTQIRHDANAINRITKENYSNGFLAGGGAI